jgi:ClpP class serine protease
MFMDLVRTRRPKLGEDPELFSGAFWSGKRAVELGLADQLGDLRSIMRARYGDDVRLRMIATERAPWWRRRLGFARSDHDPALLVDRALAAVEERLMWSRFGL